MSAAGVGAWSYVAGIDGPIIFTLMLVAFAAVIIAWRAVVAASPGASVGEGRSTGKGSNAVKVEVIDSHGDVIANTGDGHVINKTQGNVTVEDKVKERRYTEDERMSMHPRTGLNRAAGERVVAGWLVANPRGHLLVTSEQADGVHLGFIAELRSNAVTADGDYVAHTAGTLTDLFNALAAAIAEDDGE